MLSGEADTISACGAGQEWQPELGELSGRVDTISHKAAISASEKGQEWQAASVSRQAINACERGQERRLELGLLSGETARPATHSTMSFPTSCLSPLAHLSACGKRHEWQLAPGSASEDAAQGGPDAAAGCENLELNSNASSCCSDFSIFESYEVSQQGQEWQPEFGLLIDK